ncbi:hypothetical protein SLS55_002602 [Diplodia seriata]|uniref:Uncharacterized protein n=1 Tax=Diplodia seriata TaxID=420778 RepID=A0ABR3CSN8_9PEZI
MRQTTTAITCPHASFPHLATNLKTSATPTLLLRSNGKNLGASPTTRSLGGLATVIGVSVVNSTSSPLTGALSTLPTATPVVAATSIRSCVLATNGTLSPNRFLAHSCHAQSRGPSTVGVPQCMQTKPHASPSLCGFHPRKTDGEKWMRLMGS